MVFNLFKSSSSLKVNRSTCGLIMSTIFLCLGLTLYVGLDYIVAQVIYSKLTLLQSDSELYDKWVKIPIPLSLKVWVFEETNPDDIWSGKKPVLREKGPYVFSLFREKRILDKDEDNGTIKYSEHNLYFFNESESVGSLEDKIFTLNVPTVTIADKLGSIASKLPMKSLTGISLELIGNGLFEAHKEQLMAEMTVNELLFKGQKVKILKTLETVWAPLSLLGIKFPSTGLKDNTYGLFYGQNATFGDPLEIVGQGSKLGSIIAWKNNKKLNIWPGDSCNRLKGTDGAVFSPYVDKNQDIYIFIPDLCSNKFNVLIHEDELWLTPIEPKKLAAFKYYIQILHSKYITFNYDSTIIFRGINGYRFVLSDLTFANKYRYPSNDCFCPTKGFPCNADGVTSVGPCKANAPVYLSRPHFLSASNFFSESIEGLKPNESIHQSFIDLEPTTGTPLRAKVQLQINVFVRRFPFIKTMSDIRKETLYPLVWFEQSAEINDELAAELTNKLVKPLSYVAIVKYAFLITTLLLFLLCLIWKYLSRKKSLVSKKDQQKPESIKEHYRKKRSFEAQRFYHNQKRLPSKHQVTKLEPFISHRQSTT